VATEFAVSLVLKSSGLNNIQQFQRQLQQVQGAASGAQGGLDALAAASARLRNTAERTKNALSQTTQEIDRISASMKAQKSANAEVASSLLRTKQAYEDLKAAGRSGGFDEETVAKLRALSAEMEKYRGQLAAGKGALAGYGGELDRLNTKKDRLTKLTQAQEAAQRSWRGQLLQTADAIKKLGSDLGAALPSISGLKAALAGLGLGALAASIIKTTSSFEQLELSLTAFTGSTQQAQAAFEAFKYIAVESPFDTMQVAAAGKTLLSFGASAHEAADMTRRLSMVAGATGADLGLMALNLGQIRTLGRATTMDLKQMAMQGIPIYQELGKVMYGTANAAAQVQKDVSDGKVPYAQVQKALENLTRAGSAYEKQATAQLNSLQGLWATLQSAVQEAGNAIGKAFGDEIRSALATGIAYVELFVGWLEKNGEAIARNVKGAIDFAKAIGPWIVYIGLVVKAYQAWFAISKATAAVQAFIIGLTGKGLILVVGAAGAAGLAMAGLNKVIGDVGEQMKGTNVDIGESKNKWEGLLAGLGKGTAAVGEVKEEANQLKEAFEAGKTAIQGQYAALQANLTLLQQQADNADRVTQARLTAEQAINNAQLQSLQTALQKAATDEDRKNIAEQIYQLEIANAQAVYQATLSQIDAEVRKAQIAQQTAQLRVKEMQAVLQLAIAQKQVTTAHFAALQAAQEAAGLANQNLAATRQIAGYQRQGATAAFDAASQAARVNYETNSAAKAAAQFAGGMQAAASAASSVASSMNSASKSAGGSYGGSGTGRLYGYDFGNAGKDPAFERAVVATVQDLLKTYGRRGMFDRLFHEAMGGFMRQANKTNGKVPGYAKGGYVSGPTLATIGEGGEAEYVIPASKMGAAMANYAAGRRGDSVLNPQVNITTGPVTQMGGVNYVTQQDLMSATASAAKQGASMALGMLRSNPATRRTVGLR
jgi:hypothetical protein